MKTKQEEKRETRENEKEAKELRKKAEFVKGTNIHVRQNLKKEGSHDSCFPY